MRLTRALSVFALLPPYMETFLIVYVMPVVVLALFAIPFVSRSGAKHPAARPVAVAGVGLVMTTVMMDFHNEASANYFCYPATPAEG